jgi:hypothetical protein
LGEGRRKVLGNREKVVGRWRQREEESGLNSRVENNKQSTREGTASCIGKLILTFSITPMTLFENFSISQYKNALRSLLKRFE